MKYFTIHDSDFGDLEQYVIDENVTDINWNGKALWIDDLVKGRFCSKVILQNQFVSVLSQKISNSVNENFNKYYPLLEAETNKLRISIVHDAVTNTGYSLSIRKTPPIRRITKQSIYKGYCHPLLDKFMQACIKAKLSVIVSGTPGTGKTEYVKYLSQFIKEHHRVITIEDNLELRFSTINPYHDCVEFKVDENFNYEQAIKTSLRQRPDWIILSEARSREVEFLLESTTIGTGCITTIHAANTKSIPDRIISMLGRMRSGDKNVIFEAFDIGVLITRRIFDDKIERFIDEVCIYDRHLGKNNMFLIYKQGKFLHKTLPANFIKKFQQHNVDNPLLGGENNEK